MKNILFFQVLFLCSTLSFSQNYFPAKANSVYLFAEINASYSSNFVAVKWDSINISGQSTTFYSSNFIADTNQLVISGECFDTTAGSVLGKILINNSDSICKIINYKSDTVIIKPMASQGVSWKLYIFQNLDYISATVDSIALHTFYGITDSVKYISLTAKNSSNINISSSYNNKQLQLSKNFGIIQSLNFYMFPDLDSTLYIIKGSTNPDFGIKDLTYHDVYDYDIGDEFHYLAEETNWLYNMTDHHYYIDNGTITQTIRYVSSRADFHAGDSVKYVYHDCKRIITYLAAQADTSYLQDTINETIEFSKLNNADFNHLPFEYIGKYHSTNDSLYFYRLTTIIGGSKFLKSVMYNEVMKIDSCWASYLMDPGPTAYNFIQGGGGPFYYFADWMGYVERSELIYFNKNGETWGTPIASDCQDLFSGISDYPFQIEKVAIYPNPANDRLNIIISGVPDFEKPTFIVYDLSGKKIAESLLSAGTTAFDCTNLKSGAYYYKMISKNSSLSGKLIILH